MSSKRIKMICKLEMQPDNADHIARNVVEEDREKIASAMLDAYMGTIDQMEDTFEEALEAVKNIISREWQGCFLKQA